MPDTDVSRAAALLTELIGYRTENPGGDELALARRLARELEARGADQVDVAEVPRPDRAPGGYVYARYGTPRTLINVHLDTVPANTGWSRDPLSAEIVDGRLYGLGSADTKGAIAAVLVALSRVTPRDMGILFSGDEECGTHVLRAFTRTAHVAGIERAIVCEPTARRAGVRHRGFRGYRASIRGRGGHSSGADHMPRPIVTMARLAVALDELGAQYLDRGPADMPGLCMNVASLDGGVALNVVPDAASLIWSIRPPPGFDAPAFERRIDEAVRAVVDSARAVHPAAAIDVDVTIAHDPFACRDVAGFQALLGELVDAFVPLDFWTEAAILSACGIDAVVIGPGDIAQAHAPDEFVTLDDLAWAIELFGHVLAHHLRAP